MKKAVIMIGGGVQQVPAVSIIKELGYTAIVTDMNWHAPAFEAADVCVNISAKDIQGLISWVLMHREKYNIKGVFTLMNQAFTVASVAQSCGFPGVPSSVAAICDNKLLMKRKFDEHGVAHAEYAEVESLKQAEDFFKSRNSTGMYLKTVDGCGGKGVKAVASLSELQNVYKEIKTMTHFPYCILEKNLEGDFVDAQGFLINGEFYRGGTSDSFFSDRDEKYANYNPVEFFNISPSRQPPQIIDDVYALLEQSAKALGITYGPIGGDFVLTADGLKVVEVTPRVHGPNGSLQIMPASEGIDPVAFLIQCSAGDNADKEFLRVKKRDTALCRVFLTDKERITKVALQGEISQYDGLFAWKDYSASYKNVNQCGLAGVAAAFVRGKTFEEAMGNLKKVEENIVIE